MKRNRVFASALTSFFLAGLLLTSCSRSEREDEEQTAEKSDKRRIEVSEEVRKECQVGIAVAEPVVLKKTVKLNGKIGPNEERMVQVSPRFPGVVKSISKRLGDHVAPGEALALIESNESLQS